MPNPIAVDKEALRVLVVAIGPREAARQMGLNENTVLAWANRGNWLASTRPTPAENPLPASMQPRAITAIKPSEALLNTLEEEGKETRGYASAFAKRTLKHAASLDPEQGLKVAKSVHEAVKVASMAQPGWQDTKEAAAINLQILTQVNLHNPA